jgi:hypothetical protein
MRIGSSRIRAPLGVTRLKLSTSQARLSLCRRERIKVRVSASPLLQRKPDRLQDAVKFLADLMIPEPQRNDSLTREKFRPCLIPNLTRMIVMPVIRPIRSRALQPGNRNPVCNSLMDADGEICSLQNFGSASGAKERAQSRLPSCATNERRFTKNYFNC